MYYLERKVPISMSCIIGNHSFPLPTYRWKAIATCEECRPLEDMLQHMDHETHRIISNQPEQEGKANG